MYDLAKRSLAFAVATGGLLLTGTAFSPAFAVAGSGAIQGPAQAQGVRIDAGSASSPVNAAHRDATATTGLRARAAQAPPGSLPPRLLRSSASALGAVAAAGAGTPIPACGDIADGAVVRDDGTWTYCVTDAGSAAEPAQPAGTAGGPARTLIEVCGNTVAAGPMDGFESGSSCTNTAEGSAPTVPGAPAPGTGGASATAVSVSDGGPAAAEHAPAAGFIAACEHVAAAKMFVRDGNGCGTVRAEAARFKLLDRSGGAGSANAAGTMNAPLAGCGDMTQADTGDDGNGAAKCADSPTWPSSSPSPSQCRCSATPIHPPPPPPAPSRHPGKCDCPVTSPTHPAPPPPPPPSRHPGKCGCAHTSPTWPPPPPPPHSWPPRKCGCSPSPPPSSPPPPPSSWPAPPHSWPPSWSGSPSPSPSGSAWHHPGGPPHNGNGGGLAHTGTDIGIALGVAGAALLGGLGLRAAARRREGQG